MTKAIYCDCGLICRGDSDEELLRAAEEHLRQEHPALAGRVRGDDLLAMAVEVADPVDAAPSTAEGVLAVRRDGPVVTLVMNRPASRNALSLDLMRALRRELDTIGAEGGVRAVVIGSAGPVFSSGHDLRELHGADETVARTIFDADASLMLAIRELPQPVVARVQGPAAAAGCHLVAACDLAVASSQATFAVPGPAMGLVGATAMIEVSRLIGRRRATQMLLTGAPISAATALDWGLVNAVVPAGELETAARAIASSASAGAPETTAMAKRGLHASLEGPIDVAYRRAVDLTVRTVQGDEAQEGIDAFLAKRPPAWRAQRPGG